MHNQIAWALHKPSDVGRISAFSGESIVPKRRSISPFFALACAAFACSAAPAAAQDGSFGGLYGGIAANYTIHNVDAVQNGRRVGDGSADGFGVGLLLGWSVPIARDWYIGIDGDFSWDDRSVSLNGTRYELTHWGTLRGRVGYAMTPSLMVFASAGVALADFDFKELSSLGVNRGSEHIWGYAASTGIEFAALSSVRLRAEYMYSSFENWGFSTTIRHSEDSQTHLFRLGAVVRLF